MTAHAMDRLRQRFGINEWETMRSIAVQCDQRAGTRILRVDHKGIEHHLLTVRGEEIVALFNPDEGRVLTVLYPRAAPDKRRNIRPAGKRIEARRGNRFSPRAFRELEDEDLD